MQPQNDIQWVAAGECADAKRWPDIWEPLSAVQARVLSQVLAGYRLLGRVPDRTYAQAVADYMNARIDDIEFAKLAGREAPSPRKQHSSRRGGRWWELDDDEI